MLQLLNFNRTLPNLSYILDFNTTTVQIDLRRQKNYNKNGALQFTKLIKNIV